jgi:phosphatidylglycerol:prolipoprotein diacylglycerol transferase
VTFTNPDAHSLVGVPLNVALHPTQLYEALAEAVIFAVLYWRIGKPHRAGQIIGWYLIMYPAVRFVVEFLRAHDQPNPFGGLLSASQWITLVLVGAGVWALKWRVRTATVRDLGTSAG